MVRSCAAWNCNNKSGSKDNNGRDVTFHRFPLSNNSLNRKWIAAVRRENFRPTAFHLLCSTHFEESCYLSKYVNRRQLKDDAVPTIFEFPAHLNKVNRERRPLKSRCEEISENSGIEEVNEMPGPSTDHNYSLSSSPSKVKRKYETIVEQKENNIVRCKGRLKLMEKKCKRQTKKISKMENILQELKVKNLVNDDLIALLNSADCDILLEILDRSKNRSQQYSDKLKSFAITLNFYSPAAYRYVRSKFNLSLPHESTLRRWCNSIEGLPGFTSESFDSIKEKVAKSSQHLFCALIFDEMSIRKHIEWDGNEFVGYVNFGCVPCKSGLEGCEAKESLVLMAVGINDHWKIPIGYFLTNGISASEKSTIVQMAIKMLHDVNVSVLAVTCDGLATNLAMAKELGANIAVDNMKPYFPHPVSGNNVYIILDACHMVKLIRNMFGTVKNLIDANGKEISWNYIEKLHSIQEREGLRLANKLKLLHLNFGQQKMKVKLAVQVLSASVSNALRYLCCDLKLQEFQGAEATADFCLIFDQMFDILNSKNSFAKGFKSPIRESNIGIWGPFLEKVACYLKSLKDSNGKLLVMSNRKTGLLGFLALCETVKGLYNDVIKTKNMSYLLMYKFSQDHLEMFFSLIRGRLGWNNNPSYLQFRAAYRNLLLFNEVKCKASTNCQVQDDTSLLPWTGKKINNYDPVEFSYSRRYDQTEEANVEAVFDHDYTILPQNLTEYSSNVVVYIAGFVVKRMVNQVHCNICVHSLFSSEPVLFSDLLRRKDNGGLIMPCAGVVTVCREAEKRIRSCVSSSDKLPKGKILNDIMLNVIPKVIHQDLFPDLREHVKENVFPENHIYIIIKCAIKLYIKIRCHHIASVHNSNLHKKIIRQTLTKSILFQNQ